MIYLCILQTDTYIADNPDMFEAVASAINNMQIGYVRMADNETTDIYPSWIVSINDIDVYFDLYNAEPIGYMKK